MKKIIFTLAILIVQLQGAVCAYSSASWTSMAFQVVQPGSKYYKDGVQALNEELTMLALFGITEFNLSMKAERKEAIRFARVNAVSASMDYELQTLEGVMLSVAKMEGDIKLERLKVSELANEIQLAIIAIKSNQVIADEKNNLR